MRTCNICDFSSKYKNVFDNHLKSIKHNVKQTNNPIICIEIPNNKEIYENIVIIKKTSNKVTMNICAVCDKKYGTRSGLWKHIKKCKKPTIRSNTIDPTVLDKLNEIQNQIAPLLQNQHMLATTENELETNKKRIQLLEKTYLKKQKRIHFIDNNVVYIVTTEDNKLRRNYIVGKAKNLTHRLSTYNKTADHEVIHYMKCPDESTMNIIESMVMKKMEKYRECANRDRFILPENADISLFSNIVDSCVAFFSEDVAI